MQTYEAAQKVLEAVDGLNAGQIQNIIGMLHEYKQKAAVVRSMVAGVSNDAEHEKMILTHFRGV